MAPRGGATNHQTGSMKKFILYSIFVVAVPLAVILFNAMSLQNRQISATKFSADLSGNYAPVLAKSLSFKTVKTGKSGPSPSISLFAYLEKSFPNVFKHMQVTTFNQFSRLFVWQGQNQQLKPGLFLAHSDVVPADPANWSYPPYSGIVKDDFIWGRGAIDNKSSLVGLLAAAEELLLQGFVPQRTLYFAFGHDEETGGQEGAAAIAQHLETRAADMAFILDEGGPVTEGIIPGLNHAAALIGIAEKGYVSVKLTSSHTGGHAAMPAATTAIGNLSEALLQLQTNPLPTRLPEATRKMFIYLAPHMNWFNRTLFANLWISESLVLGKLAQSPATNAAIQSTGTATVLHAGESENVIPAEAYAVLNFRLLPGDSVETVTRHLHKITADRKIQIEVLPGYVEPSRTSATDSAAFQLLQKTIHEVFPKTLVAPFLLVTSTDSKHYQHLSNNIFRFLPIPLHKSDLQRVHGNDERIGMADFRRQIVFYMRFIMNN